VIALKRFAGPMKSMVLIGVAAVALTACASNRGNMGNVDYSGLPATQSAQTLNELTARYKRNPRDKGVVLHYAAALRGAGQSQQAGVVLEIAIAHFPKDPDISVAYAKALTEQGRFEQSLQVIDNTLRPEAPDWNALLVKGATLDQMGRNADARNLYKQAMAYAPEEASIEANMGLSYAMTNDLAAAEHHLRSAVTKRGANSRIRQNLALVVGLQGRFDEAKALYAAELPPEQVSSNMAYVRALLTQQNRWDRIPQG
jgi:Flp pilus assembly protein TadD